MPALPHPAGKMSALPGHAKMESTMVNHATPPTAGTRPAMSIAATCGNLVAAFLLVALASGCGRPASGPTVEQAIPKPAPPAPPPPEPPPIEVRLGTAMTDANLVRDQLAGHRDAIFASSLHHAEAIVCSTWRILKLQGQDYTGERIDSALGELSGRQSFLEYTGEWGEREGPDGRLQRLIKISMSVAVSDAYGGGEWAIEAPRRYRGWLNEEGLRRRCPDLYGSPIPNDPEARGIEQRAFASEIAQSIQRLSAYEQRLPILERNISRALVLEAKTRKSQVDPVVAQGEDYATKALSEYEIFSEEATQIIQQMQQAAAVEPVAEDQDVKAILEAIEG